MMCVSILQAGVSLKVSCTRYLREDSFSNAFIPTLGELTVKVAYRDYR